MRIRTLDVIEDSNVFLRSDFSDTIPVVLPYTLNIVEQHLGKIVAGIARIDRFPKGVEVDVPERQGENLIQLGLAERVESV